MAIQAKRYPPYVHGRLGVSSLIHRVERVEVYWDFFGRFRLSAHTVCGTRFDVAQRGALCQTQPPQVPLCGRCQGKPATFSRRGSDSHRVSESRARLRVFATPFQKAS